MQVGLEFGALLGRFLVDFGAKLGAKLDPKSIKNRSKNDVEKMSENCFQKCHAPDARTGGGGPLNQSIQTPRGTQLGIRHSSRALKARWRKY